MCGMEVAQEAKCYGLRGDACDEYGEVQFGIGDKDGVDGDDRWGSELWEEVDGFAEVLAYFLVEEVGSFWG